MPCGSCVDKLAVKLMSHHKIDMIRAYELAEKGMERHETKTVTKEQIAALGFDPDYSGACTVGGSCACNGSLFPCYTVLDCQILTACTCTCAAPWILNSHYVSGCSKAGTGCSCDTLNNLCRDGRTCTCRCIGLCYYSCDAGYVWNPVTLQCDLIPLPIVGGISGNAFVIAVSMLSQWIRRRRKRRFIVTLK